MNSENILKNQQGMSMMAWLVVLGILVFFILIGIKMTPTYLENYSIRDSLEQMAADRNARAMTANELRKNLIKRFKINSVYEFDRDAIKIKKDKSGTRVDVVYEVRKPVIGNVSIVMAFAEHAIIPPP